MVITAVFLHETFRVVGMNDELMIVNKSRACEKFKQKMRSFLAEVDNSGDDVIQRKEFVAGLNGTRMKTWLSSMNVEVADSDLLFDLIGGGE